MSTLPDDGKASTERTLQSAFDIEGGDLSPVSVVAAPNGLFFVQNGEAHNIAVFDRAGKRLTTIADTATTADGRSIQGSPMEAALTPDGKHLYVTNFEVTAPGERATLDENCEQVDDNNSFVYRVDTATLKVDQVIEVGAGAEFATVTPDGRRLLVSNWCGFDLSVVDLATAREITRIPIGRHPRGIAVTGDSRTAWVGVMGDHEIVEVDLEGLAEAARFEGGVTPRHLVLSHDDKVLFVSNNRDFMVRAFDTATRRETSRVVTGARPRTIALSPDGTVLYVVNFDDDTLVKVDVSDVDNSAITVIQSAPTGDRPIGVAYDPPTRQVWVANASGSVSVLTDS